MKDEKVVDWLNQLGSKSPTPGGGAVAAMSAALSASILKMVCDYTTGPKFADVEKSMNLYSKQLEVLNSHALQQIKADGIAFAKISQAYKKSSSTDSEKTEKENAIARALFGAANEPLAVIKIAEKILEIANMIKDRANKNLLSDVAVATASASSSVESAIINIEVNLVLIKDKKNKEMLQKSISNAEKLIVLADLITKELRDRINNRVAG